MPSIRVIVTLLLVAGCFSGTALAAPNGPLADAPAAGRRGGDLVWAVDIPAGRFLYQLAVDAEGIYAAGNASDRTAGGRGLVEKRAPADGSLIWSRHIAVGQELMSITIDTEAMYLITSPWQVMKRRLSDGERIWQQASEGKPYDIVIDGDALYAAGWGRRPGGVGSWRIEKRCLIEGDLIWEQIHDFRGVALALTVQDDGVYVGGYEVLPDDDYRNQHWRIEKLDLTDGERIWAQAHNPGAGNDKVYGLAADETGVYAAGQDSAVDSGQWRIEKRNLSDGTLIWQQVHNPSPELDKAHGLTLDATGLYIPGYQDGDRWRIEKRSLANGAPIWTALGPEGGRLWYAVAVDDTAVYVGGHIDGQWRIEKRIK